MGRSTVYPKKFWVFLGENVCGVGNRPWVMGIGDTAVFSERKGISVGLGIGDWAIRRVFGWFGVFLYGPYEYVACFRSRSLENGVIFQLRPISRRPGHAVAV